MPKRRRGMLFWVALAVSAVLHVLLFLAWRHFTAVPVAHELQPSMLMVQLLPAPVSAQSTPQPSGIGASRPTRRAAVVSGVAAPLDAPSATGHATVSPADSELTSSPDLAARAVAMAAKSDRTMRIAEPQNRNFLERPLQTNTARLERAFGAAGVPRGTTLEEHRTGSGQIYTKIISSRGAICYFGREAMPNAATFGTPFDYAVKGGRCPK